jgi:hypothetical protein
MGALVNTGWPLIYKSEYPLYPNNTHIETNNQIIDILFWLLVSVLIVHIPQIIAYFGKKQ